MMATTTTTTKHSFIDPPPKHTLQEKHLARSLNQYAVDEKENIDPKNVFVEQRKKSSFKII